MAQCYGKILWNSVLPAATASFTGTPVDGFPQSAAVDWLDYTGFRVTVPASSSVTATWTFPAGASMNGIAFLLRPVSGGALTIAAKKAGATIASWSYTPTDPLTLCRFALLTTAETFTAGQALDILFTNAAGTPVVVDVREIAAGTVLTLETGQRAGLPRMANRFGQVVAYSMSINGSVIGRDIIRREKSATIEQDYATESWISTSWAPFIAHAERKAFFWAWHVGTPTGNVAAGLDPCLAVATSIGQVENRAPAPFLKTSLSISCFDGFTPGGIA
jgi:hypothetical protein